MKSFRDSFLIIRIKLDYDITHKFISQFSKWSYSSFITFYMGFISVRWF